MATIRVPESGPIWINDGGTPVMYKVTNGEVVVDEAHVSAILGAIQGSSLKPEPPVKPKSSEAPTKEK